MPYTVVSILQRVLVKNQVALSSDAPEESLSVPWSPTFHFRISLGFSGPWGYRDTKINICHFPSQIFSQAPLPVYFSLASLKCHGVWDLRWKTEPYRKEHKIQYAVSPWGICQFLSFTYPGQDSQTLRESSNCKAKQVCIDFSSLMLLGVCRLEVRAWEGDVARVNTAGLSSRLYKGCVLGIRTPEKGQH